MMVRTKKVGSTSSVSRKSKTENDVLVITKVNEEFLTYFKEPQDKVRKLLTEGNKIVELKTTYADASKNKLLTPHNRKEFVSEFQKAANLAGERGLERINVTLTIEENLVTNPSDDLPSDPKSKINSKSSVTNPNNNLPGSPKSNDTAKKITKLVISKKKKKIWNINTRYEQVKRIS